MTLGQRLYRSARLLADLAHETSARPSLGAATRQDIATLAIRTTTVAGWCNLHGSSCCLASAGQCEWVIAHLRVVDGCTRTLLTRPRVSEFPKTLAHLHGILRDVERAIHNCRTWVGRNDPGPYGTSRHLSDTPIGEADE